MCETITGSVFRMKDVRRSDIGDCRQVAGMEPMLAPTRLRADLQAAAAGHARSARAARTTAVLA